MADSLADLDSLAEPDSLAEADDGAERDGGAGGASLKVSWVGGRQAAAPGHGGSAGRVPDFGSEGDGWPESDPDGVLVSVPDSAGDRGPEPGPSGDHGLVPGPTGDHEPEPGSAGDHGPEPGLEGNRWPEPRSGAWGAPGDVGSGRLGSSALGRESDPVLCRPTVPSSLLTRCQKWSSDPRLGATLGHPEPGVPGLSGGGPPTGSRACGLPPVVSRAAGSRAAGSRAGLGARSRAGSWAAPGTAGSPRADPAAWPVARLPAEPAARPTVTEPLASNFCRAEGTASGGLTRTIAPWAPKISWRCRNTPAASSNAATAHPPIDTYTIGRLLAITPETSKAIATATRRALNRITSALHGPYG
jgi:hypothetical protein